MGLYLPDGSVYVREQDQPKVRIRKGDILVLPADTPEPVARSFDLHCRRAGALVLLADDVDAALESLRVVPAAEVQRRGLYARGEDPEIARLRAENKRLRLDVWRGQMRDRRAKGTRDGYCDCAKGDTRWSIDTGRGALFMPDMACEFCRDGIPTRPRG
jgi:hypothetical protein